MRNPTITFDQSSGGGYDVFADGQRLGHIGPVGRTWSGRHASGQTIEGCRTRKEAVEALRRMGQMTDPYDYTPLRQQIANVVQDYADGGLDGIDEAVQAIFDHPEFGLAWEVAADAPRDGTMFVFRERHPATYAISTPMVGRYLDGVLECYTGSHWRPWIGELSTWAKIPVA